MVKVTWQYSSAGKIVLEFPPAMVFSCAMLFASIPLS
jgi:hypothetical protein